MTVMLICLQVLYEYVEGEDDPPGSTSNSDAPLLAAAAMQAGNLDDALTPDSSSRVQLAAMQRKANISRWLQRKLKPTVEDALRALQNPGSSQQQQQDAGLWSLLHLMTGRQVAAAAAVAIAVGDVRLATLLTAAGQAAAGLGGRHVVTQMQVWPCLHPSLVFFSPCVHCVMAWLLKPYAANKLLQGWEKEMQPHTEIVQCSSERSIEQRGMVTTACFVLR